MLIDQLKKIRSYFTEGSEEALALDAAIHLTEATEQFVGEAQVAEMEADPDWPPHLPHAPMDQAGILAHADECETDWGMP